MHQIDVGCLKTKHIVVPLIIFSKKDPVEK